MRPPDSLVSGEMKVAVFRSVPAEGLRAGMHGGTLLYGALGVLVLLPSLLLVTPGLKASSLRSKGIAVNNASNAPAAVVAFRSPVSR